MPRIRNESIVEVTLSSLAPWLLGPIAVLCLTGSAVFWMAERRTAPGTRGGGTAHHRVYRRFEVKPALRGNGLSLIGWPLDRAGSGESPCLVIEGEPVAERVRSTLI